MRARLLTVLFMVVAGPAFAAAGPADVPGIKGLWLATDFPALQLRAGDDTSLSLTLYNYGLPPQRTALSIADLPADWKAEIDGDGKKVSAAFVDYNGKSNLSLKLTVPASAKPGPYNLVVKAAGEGGSSDLPIAIDLAPPLAAKLTATPKLPVLKGTPRSSFDFTVTVKNESPSNMLINLNAGTPRGFQATFKEGYGTQELTSLPFKAGESKDIKVSIKPAPGTAAGKYPVTVDFVGEKAKVDAELTLDVSGEPALSLAGEDERVSGQAYAGKEKSFPLILRNTGTASARDISLSASPPSGWKISFDPKDIAEVAAASEQKVTPQSVEVSTVIL